MLKYLLLLQVATGVKSWMDCGDDQGGGFCPDETTCCPTDTPGLSNCIPTRPGKDPASSGHCCDLTTACAFGFQCAVYPYTNKQYCRIDNLNPPENLSHDVPRYEMCQIPDESMKVLHGFPMMPFQDQFAYYSNMGPITAKHSDQLKKVEKVLIMIHGSSRNAEDYFCASLSLVPKEERDKVLVITPRFLAPDDIDGIIAEYVENNNIWFYQEDDETVSDGSAPPHLEFLIWQDKSSDGFPLSHTWRYGADAMSAPISSFDALDRLVAFLDRTKSIFPNLKQVSVAGHSAGGQFSHRWALLSNEAFWSSREVEIRAIAANPRSYCYLDERRWIQVDENTMMFEKPSDESIGSCPEYNEWTWGLEEGEYLDCRYKDLAVNQTSSSAMAERYALRNVSYLTGEYDTITQDDHCATHSFQGRDRHERALNYFAALKTFFSSTYLNHQIYTVPESPHDHFLMFQSAAGRNAIMNSTNH